jgi:hypothetical protein
VSTVPDVFEELTVAFGLDIVKLGAEDTVLWLDYQSHSDICTTSKFETKLNYRAAYAASRMKPVLCTNTTHSHSFPLHRDGDGVAGHKLDR